MSAAPTASSSTPAAKPRATAAGLIASGVCVGCNAAAPRVAVDTVRAFAPPTANPLARRDTKGVGLTSNCLASNAPPEPFERNGRMICGNQLRISGRQVLELSPGTCVPGNTGLRMQGQSEIRCSTCIAGRGVTMFLTGTPRNSGGITVNAGTVLNSAPLTVNFGRNTGVTPPTVAVTATCTFAFIVPLFGATTWTMNAAVTKPVQN
jgi:hypothetical protein